LVGCDVVATPIPDIDRFQSPLLIKCRGIEDWEAALGKERTLQPRDVERHLEELEAAVRIEAALPGWLHAIGLESL
jgi:hypothetical protein